MHQDTLSFSYYCYRNVVASHTVQRVTHVPFPQFARIALPSQIDALTSFDAPASYQRQYLNALLSRLASFFLLSPEIMISALLAH